MCRQTKQRLAVHRMQQVKPVWASHRSSTQIPLPCLGGPAAAGPRAAAHLDLHEVRLPLAQLDLFDLGVGQHTDDAGMLAELVQGLLDLCLALILLCILGEGPFLGLGPAIGREWGYAVCSGQEIAQLLL